MEPATYTIDEFQDLPVLEVVKAVAPKAPKEVAPSELEAAIGRPG